MLAERDQPRVAGLAPEPQALLLATRAPLGRVRCRSSTLPRFICEIAIAPLSPASIRSASPSSWSAPRSVVVALVLGDDPEIREQRAGTRGISELAPDGEARFEFDRRGIEVALDRRDGARDLEHPPQADPVVHRLEVPPRRLEPPRRLVVLAALARKVGERRVRPRDGGGISGLFCELERTGDTCSRRRASRRSPRAPLRPRVSHATGRRYRARARRARGSRSPPRSRSSPSPTRPARTRYSRFFSTFSLSQ